jgi:hypothetical protein
MFNVGDDVIATHEITRKNNRSRVRIGVGIPKAELKFIDICAKVAAEVDGQKERARRRTC